MLKPKHLKKNIRAIEECRFTAAELELIRKSMAQGTHAH
jgi:hypothetical protein